MNYLDLIIIYLACGSSFGVYYFLNNRQKTKPIWLKSIFIVIIWIPYAIKLLHTKIAAKLNNDSETANINDLNKLEKQFEHFLPQDHSEISLFEFREVIGRYSELTKVSKEMKGVISNHEKQVYRLTKNQNTELSAICLNRRNHKKLQLHQTKAREDFLQTVEILIKSTNDIKKINKLSLEFVKILNDDLALASIHELFATSKQTDNKTIVKDWETEIWNTQELRQSNEKPISTPLQTITLTTTAEKKD